MTLSPDFMAPVRFGNAPAHVLVTGGTGFIGRLVVKALLADGHAVSVWTRDTAAAARIFDAGVRCVRRLEEMPPTPAVEVIVNLAGAPIVGPRWTAHRQAELLASREGLTQKLIEWIGTLAVKPWLMLSGSAIGYYGVQSPDDAAELTESSPPQDIFMSRLCQRWEAAAHTAAQHGVRVVCMRFGLVLGHGGALPKLLAPIRLGMGGRLGTGRQCTSWIHVNDIVRGMGQVWGVAAQPDASSAPQAYNFTAPGYLSQEAFARTAAQVLHRPFWMPTPAWPVRLALGEQADVLLEGQRVVPAHLEQTGFRFRFPDASSALQDLC
ncbi:TIGR01777 family oxidoreductase [soil metagenome]